MDASGTPEPRGTGTRLLDGAAGRLLRLPDATSDFTITRNVRVPMRDGVTLAGDLYRPDATRAAGTLLIRGPYGRGLAFSMSLARIFAARGYQALFVSCRGTFGSGGEFDPMRTEIEDGHDVVAWLREQPWFTGTFATLGPSYLGFTQWALLSDPPEEMAAAVSLVGPHDFAERIWGTGAFSLEFLGWSDMIAHQEDGGMAGRRRALTARRRLAPVLDRLPLADAADAHLDGRAPWFRYRVTHPDIDEPYWAPMRYGAALDRADLPILLIGGWQDLFLRQTMEQYERLSARGVDVAMTVGPWQHVEVMSKGAPVVARETLEWLDENLAHRAPRRRAMPVRIFVTGAGEWRDLPSWPLATVPYALYTGAGGVLNPTAPSSGRSTFTYDPADPTPTVGGPLLTGGGIVDDRPLTARPDVLSFTSGPLERDLEVLGTPRVELAHRTDNPHADLFVRLSEVDARGRSRNVTETYVRLDPERGAEPVTLDLRPAAHRFRAGNRIRLIIAGGSHPHYARNLGTGENPGTGTTMRPSRHIVAHGPSRVLLPGPAE